MCLPLSGALIGMLGLLDDTRGMRPVSKLLLQCVAVAPCVAGGLHPHQLELLGATWDLGVFAGPLTLLWLVACVNAVNLLDGLDGFAATAGMVLSAVVTGVALVSGNQGVALASMALMGAIAGFLPFNRPPASIYLGDAGSMLIGLVLGVTALNAATQSPGALPVVVPLGIMAIPLWDTATAIVRRLLLGRPISAPDRGHLHHRLLERGMTRLSILLLIAALCAMTGTAAAASLLWNIDVIVLAGVPCVFGILIAGRIFGHHELVWLCAAVARRLSTPVAGESQAIAASGTHLIGRELSPDRQQQLGQLLSEVATRYQVHHLRVTIGGAGGVSHTKRLLGAEAANHVPVLSVTSRVSAGEDRFCELRAEVTTFGATPPSSMRQLSELLTTLATRWAQRDAAQRTAIALPHEAPADEGRARQRQAA